MGLFLISGMMALFSVPTLAANCSIKGDVDCRLDAACEWNDSSKICEVRTQARCDQIATVHWDSAAGECVKGFDPNVTATENVYREAEAGDPGDCARFTESECETTGGSYCKWKSISKQCVSANADLCDLQTDATQCDSLNQCFWDDTQSKCLSNLFGIGEGADEREADCNLLEQEQCAISEMCTWEKRNDETVELCHAKKGFLGIGTGKNKEARRLCEEALEMLQVPNLTAGEQAMYEDQQQTYCNESLYIDTYQGPVFGGPGLKAGAQMSGSYLDASISKERSLPKLAIAWTRFLLQIGAVLAVIAFITAGIFYVTDFGDGSRVELAKKIIIWTAVGIILIMGSYAIVNTLMKARFGDTDRGAVVGQQQTTLIDLSNIQ